MKVNGRAVLPVELYEARCLRDATSYRAQRRYGPQGAEELHPPATLLDVRALLGEPRVLVYGVTPAGRSVCVTERVLAVYDACVRGEVPWGYPVPPAVTPFTPLNGRHLP